MSLNWRIDYILAYFHVSFLDLNYINNVMTCMCRFVLIVLLMAVKCKNMYIWQDNYSSSGVWLYNGRLNFTEYQHTPTHAKCGEIGNVETNYV